MSIGVVSRRWCGLALILLALPGVCEAQPLTEPPREEVVVLAPYLVRQKEIKTSIRTPVLFVSLRRQVSYADLDLSIPADAMLLQSRIQQAADVACKQLGTLYPPAAYVPLSNVADCAKAAGDQAMMVAKEIVTFWRTAPR